MWSGNYKNWSEATKKCNGYDDAHILEECKKALQKVKNGEAVYERDGVIYSEVSYAWGILAGLQKAAIENDGKLCVIDFGGSLGSTYYQHIDFLKGIKNIDWCIIEQKHFVDCGKEYFENDQLKFYYSIEEALQYHKPNVLLLSSVVNYLEYANKWVDQFASLEIPYVIVDRTSFVKNHEDLITIQKNPNSNPEISYPCWFFHETKFVKRFKKYNKLADINSEVSSLKIDDAQEVYWKGFIFKLNK